MQELIDVSGGEKDDGGRKDRVKPRGTVAGQTVLGQVVHVCDYDASEMLEATRGQIIGVRTCLRSDKRSAESCSNQQTEQDKLDLCRRRIIWTTYRSGPKADVCAAHDGGMSGAGLGLSVGSIAGCRKWWWWGKRFESTRQQKLLWHLRVWIGLPAQKDILHIQGEIDVNLQGPSIESGLPASDRSGG